MSLIMVAYAVITIIINHKVFSMSEVSILIMLAMLGVVIDIGFTRLENKK